MTRFMKIGTLKMKRFASICKYEYTKNETIYEN